jgi:hypothetical protein
MDDKLMKSLTDLIDETLGELEELKKSKFSAAEIKIEGPGEGIAGKPTNGKLDAKAEKKDEDEDEDEDEEEKEEAEKAEPFEGKETDEEEDEEEKKKEAKKAEETAKAEGIKEKKPASPGVVKDSGVNVEKKEDIGYPKGTIAQKSDEEVSTLMKSLIDERLAPMEEKLSSILASMKTLMDAPMPQKGFTSKMVPLKKSEDETSTVLSKSDVVNKLMELKKTGKDVDSLDVTKAELGGPVELNKIVEKYKLS